VFAVLPLTPLHHLHYHAIRAGMPVLTAGVSWDARHSQLLLALRQSGGKAVLRGALKGADKPVLPPGGVHVSRGTCQLKVLVRELDAVEEHCLQVGLSSLVLLWGWDVLGGWDRGFDRQGGSYRPSGALVLSGKQVLFPDGGHLSRGACQLQVAWLFWSVCPVCM
jgi:hypothetical protein